VAEGHIRKYFKGNHNMVVRRIKAQEHKWMQTFGSIVLL
jgi:hypothetical protein